jgi:hypothetical protein
MQKNFVLVEAILLMLILFMGMLPTFQRYLLPPQV